MDNFGYFAQSAFPLVWILVPAIGAFGLGGMFLWGALAGHVNQWFANGEDAPGNTGGVLVNDLLIPAVMIILAVRSRRLATATPRPAGRLAS